MAPRGSRHTTIGTGLLRPCCMVAESRSGSLHRSNRSTGSPSDYGKLCLWRSERMQTSFEKERSSEALQRPCLPALQEVVVRTSAAVALVRQSLAQHTRDRRLNIKLPGPPLWNVSV